MLPASKCPIPLESPIEVEEEKMAEESCSEGPESVEPSEKGQVQGSESGSEGSKNEEGDHEDIKCEGEGSKERDTGQWVKEEEAMEEEKDNGIIPFSGIRHFFYFPCSWPLF